jgi:hypothetical protein
MKSNGEELLTIETTREHGIWVKEGRCTIQDAKTGEIKDITDDLTNSGHFVDGKLVSIYVVSPEKN